MTTAEVDETHPTNASGVTSSRLSSEFYFQCAVMLVGVVGTAGNGLVLYALVVSKQHKKHVLIVNLNAMDLFSSLSVIVSYAMKIGSFHLTTAPAGNWLCMTQIIEGFIWLGTNGSAVNLAAISIDRYLRVVHRAWSAKTLRPWMTYAAAAVSWLIGIVYNMTIMLITLGIVDGLCHSYATFNSDVGRIAACVVYVLFFYVIMLVVFVLCYGRILVAVHRQVDVMAAHSSTAAGSTTAHTGSSKMKSGLIKTMILVCAFYALTRLPTNVYMILFAADPYRQFLDGPYYASVFLAFLYTGANPFIYAAKFEPVRKILRAMIPCKKSSATGNTTETNRRSAEERL